MPDAGQYAIAIVLSLMNIISIRDKISNLNISIRFF